MASGAPNLMLNDGGTATYNAATSNLSTGSIVFDYTVGANDAIPNLAISQVNVPFGTTIQDSSGKNADFSAALNQSTGLQINPAYVSYVATSKTGDVNSLGTVQISLVMSGAVSVSLSGG